MTETLPRVVSLVLLTDLPDLGHIAVLQRRGRWRSDKPGYRVSWAGGCQFTSHGLVPEWSDPGILPLTQEICTDPGKLREKVLGVLFSHVQAQLGYEVFKFIRARQQHIAFLGVTDTKRVRAAHFGLFLPDPDFLNQMKLHHGSAGPDYVQASVPIANLELFPREKGVPDMEMIAMFPDDRDALARAPRDCT